MNAQLLTRLVAALTPDSALRKMLLIPPLAARLGMRTRRGALHVRAGITKNHGRGETKARRQMTKASRRRNRI